MKRRNWTPEEQQIVIRLYFWMLGKQAKGEKFNKAQLARDTLPCLNDRTKGSYEAKLMNISAVMRAHGLPIVKGYVPLGHAQKSLTDAVMSACPPELMLEQMAQTREAAAERANPKAAAGFRRQAQQLRQQALI